MKTGGGEKGKAMLRQTPQGKGIVDCGKYKFYINEEIEDPDFWVVRGKSLKQKETCSVAPENTILLTSEPRTILNYPKKYRDQFGLLCSCQDGIKHRNVIYTPALLPWFVGVSEQKNSEPTLTYDKLKQMETPAKTKLISVITSNKAFTKGHQQRIEFVERLKEHYGDKIDIFGRGYNSFDDKWDVLAPYKYHISIENSSSKHYWTEKISDCYLAETFPIYYGCTNIGDYFPKGSYEEINILNAEQAIAVIDNAINNNLYEQRKELLHECKELVLEDYNIFNLVASYCDTLDATKPKKRVTLKPANSLLDPHNFYLYLFNRNIFSMKRWLKTAFSKKDRLKNIASQ